MLGRDLVLQAFREYGVEYLFGNPGTTELPLMDGLVHYRDIEFIVSLHEDICVGMAAGYAQATGKPGVVNLHAAPGVGHGFGNIYNAYRAGVPMVITAGNQDTRHAIQEPQLSGEIVPLVQNYTKWSYEIRSVSELPVALHRAFKMATTDPMGPVFLSFPSDILWQEIDQPPIPLTHVHKSRGSREAIEQAAQLILKGTNPVIIAGDRIDATDSMAAVVRLAESVGAKVYAEHQSSALNFPYDHPQFQGRMLPNGSYIQQALAEADPVIYIGPLSHAPLMYFNQLMVGKTPIIAIDNSEWQLGKNQYIDAAILGDPGLVAHDVTDRIEQIATPEHLRTFGERKLAAEQLHTARELELIQQAEANKNYYPLSPAVVMHKLKQALPNSAFVVDESVTSGPYVHNYLTQKHPRTLIALKGGGLGYGMPAALGAQLGRPDHRVVAVIGDGSALYYIQSLWNAAKHKLPVVYVIMNNQSYMVLKGSLLNINGEAAKHGFFPGMDLTEPAVDFPRLAEGFGIESLVIQKAEELEDAYRYAFQERRPILLDVRIDPTVKVFHK